MVQGIVPRPSPPSAQATDQQRDHFFTWHQRDEKAQGIMRLRMSPSVLQMVKSKDTAKEIYDELKALYSALNAATIYAEFKAAINVRVPADQHPAPYIIKMTEHFEKLEENKVDIPVALRAMIALNVLPSRYDGVAQMILQTAKSATSLTVAEVRGAVTLAFEQSAGKKAPSSQPHGANKISAVKRKNGDPSFRQQQQQQPAPSGSGSSGAQNNGGGNAQKKKSSRGKCGGKKFHQQDGQAHQASAPQFASSASLPPADFGQRHGHRQAQRGLDSHCAPPPSCRRA